MNETEFQPKQQKNSINSVIKQFKHRESLLTNLIINNSHIRSLHNLILALVSISVLTIIGDYISYPKKFQNDFQVYIWNNMDFQPFIKAEITMNCVVLFLVYPLVLFKNFLQYHRLVIDLLEQNSSKDLDQAYDRWFGTEQSIRKNNLPQLICYGLYGLITIYGLLIYCPLHILTHDIKIVGSFALMLEMARLLMKAHSFFIEKKDLHLEKNEFKKLLKLMNRKNQFTTIQMVQSFWRLTSRPKFSNLLYYLFAPTLIYRDSYPRTEKIRWKFVLNLSFQMFLLCALYFIIICRFLVENFSRIGLESYEIKNFSRFLFYIFLFGMISFPLLFYGFLHLYLNITGELLRFADRFYYDEWWDSISLKEFYRKWNLVVQDWLFTYIYQPIYQKSHNRAFAGFSVIIISAIIHELIIGITLKFYFPAMFFCFAIGGYFYYLITKNVQKAGYQNMLFLMNIFFGCGILSTLYSMEWYSRINCPYTTSTLSQLFIPRLINCIKFQ